jgi:hypothetical protein
LSRDEARAVSGARKVLSDNRLVPLPVIRGVIQRRLLVNYRVKAEVLRGLLPSPFEPKTVDGWGMAGICLIHLAQLRPRGVPAPFGLSSENAAHRIAVVWGEEKARQEGVFVARRDTSSWWNVAAGGRLFPGVHHRARFDVQETPERLRVALESEDRATRVAVAGTPAASLTSSSIFGSLEEASRFFERGSCGYSPGRRRSRFQGLELRTQAWSVVPFEVSELRSSFFESTALFPEGSMEFDCALLMRDIAHEWHALPSIGSTRDGA